MFFQKSLLQKSQKRVFISIFEKKLIFLLRTLVCISSNILVREYESSPSPLLIGKMHKQGLLSVLITWDVPSCGEIKILSFFLGRRKRYLVVCNFGCLIQILDCLQLLSAIQCLECASMTYFLFISRKI
jgi:hypothetical protein